MDLLGQDADLGSEFEYDPGSEQARSKRADLATKAKPSKQKLASKSEVTEEYNKEEARTMRFHILSMDAYSRHKKLINDYLMYFGGTRAELKRDSSRDKTDIDVIHENHRFLWSDRDVPEENWEKRMAKKYHDKLFKEYCITDLSRYRENKVAMRWRTEQEVIAGKGQFVCGEKRCPAKDDLRSWEVNFGYIEHGEKKNALVKLRLCPECSYKLNYHKKRKEVVKRKKRDKAEHAESSDSKRQKTRDSRGDGEKDIVAGTAETQSSTSETTADTSEPSVEQLWQGPAKVPEDKSRDTEFEEYFEDMFM